MPAEPQANSLRASSLEVQKTAQRNAQPSGQGQRYKPTRPHPARRLNLESHQAPGGAGMGAGVLGRPSTTAVVPRATAVGTAMVAAGKGEAPRGCSA